MGYQTLLMILNDTLSDCVKNAQDTMDAIESRAGSGMDDEVMERMVGYRVRALPGQMAVPAIHHASDTVLVASGGNCCTKLLHAGNIHHHTPEGQIELLEAWADKLGYRVVKKRS
jgi:hypothetical protein